jgi:stearoyl-CoA desaturase (Delta-9 desaturase)
MHDARQENKWKLVDTTIFLGFHVVAIALAIHAGPSWGALALCAGLYTTFMFGVTAGYHRYFSHRTYKTSRAFQLVLALLGSLSLQKGVLWWAAHHRRHHRESDQPADVHSPVQRGFLWSHIGWIISDDFVATDWDGIKDMARYPELRWLNRHYIVPYVLMCGLVFFTLGYQYLVWGCFMSTLLLWHATFCINSLAHVAGRRVYETTDQSRNNWVLALVTGGEGWHNNHHFYAASARQGFRWWELDVSYYVICLLERVGLVWDVKRPAPEVVQGWLGGKNHLVVDAPESAAAPIAAAVAVAAAAALSTPTPPVEPPAVTMSER